MNSRARELISEFGLQCHPEGGYFREVFRSAHKVQPLDERSERSALTTIYYLLMEGQHSRWHRVASDEAWHFYQGDPLQVYWVDGQSVIHQEVLGIGTQPMCVVPRGCWQAAKLLGEYSFVGCTVGPGFDFRDFEMLSEGSAAHAHIISLAATFVELV